MGNMKDDPSPSLKLGGHKQPAIELLSGESVARQVNLAATFHTLGHTGPALEFYQEALDSAVAAGDNASQMLSHTGIGAAHWQRHEFEQATANYEQALSLCQKENVQCDEAATLNCLALLWQERGDLGQAIAYFQQALVILWETGDHDAEAATLNALGIAYRKNGNVEEALEAHELALGIYRQHDDREGEAVSLHCLAIAQLAAGQCGQALLSAERAYRSRLQRGDHEGAAITGYNLALMYIEQGYLDHAEKLLQQVVEADRFYKLPDLRHDLRALEDVRAAVRNGK